jgi:hypothetical protein
LPGGDYPRRPGESVRGIIAADNVRIRDRRAGDGDIQFTGLEPFDETGSDVLYEPDLQLGKAGEEADNARGQEPRHDGRDYADSEFAANSLLQRSQRQLRFFDATQNLLRARQKVLTKMSEPHASAEALQKGNS